MTYKPEAANVRRLHRKTFAGIKCPNRPPVVEVDGRTLDQRLDLKVFTGGGFAWGNGSAAAHQLALAILGECYDDDDARQLANDFKWQIVSTWRDASGREASRWVITSDDVDEWRENHLDAPRKPQPAEPRGAELN